MRVLAEAAIIRDALKACAAVLPGGSQVELSVADGWLLVRPEMARYGWVVATTVLDGSLCAAVSIEDVAMIVRFLGRFEDGVNVAVGAALCGSDDQLTTVLTIRRGMETLRLAGR